MAESLVADLLSCVDVVVSRYWAMIYQRLLFVWGRGALPWQPFLPEAANLTCRMDLIGEMSRSRSRRCWHGELYKRYGFRKQDYRTILKV